MKTIYSLLALTGSVLSDVPIFCPYESSLGTWKYAIGTSGNSQEIVGKCGLDNLGTVTKYATFKLEERNKVTNLDTGSTGTYTIVSGQGFEMSIDGRKWWAYYNFEDQDCESTVVGYQRDDQLREWNCVQGTRIRGPENGRAKNVANRQKYLSDAEKYDPFYLDPNFDAKNYWADKKPIMESQYYKNDQNLINKINSQAKTWTAKSYPEFEDYTFAEMQARQGWQPVSLKKLNDQYKTGEEKLQAARDFVWPEGAPMNFDWRNVEGKRFDSPVWDQMSCGSCFAFAAKSYMETMIRIQTGLQDEPVISAQEIITCGQDENYNQGCSGGFAYLTGGKEAYERGVVAESCDPENLGYKSANSTVCPDTSGCRRYYATSYEYLGGYYGAATPEMMINHLWKLGPLSVGIAVVDDFRAYKEGIYYSLTKENGNTENTDPWNPLEATNHAVVIVGYGKCPSTIENGIDENGCVANRDEDLPYWIVKNSWGESFGEDGYIKVLLGIDEIYIESKPFVGTYA